jgi:Uma2 family endonuclease
MSAAHNSNRLSYVEYLARERASLTKSEYYAGEIFAMGGGSRNHNSISLNISTALHNKLSDGRCRPFNSDQRIRISKLNLGTYPDVSVVCGEPEGDDIVTSSGTNKVKL